LAPSEHGAADQFTASLLPASGFFSDAPVDDPDADRLRRRLFAYRIADTIASRADPESVVIGIYGRWGEGKTTVLNFIERRLAESDSIVCVRFNPWLYQSESQLLLSFFESLATAVGRTLRTRKEEMGKWLRSLGAALGTVSVGPGIVDVTPGPALQSLGASLSSVDIREKRHQLEELIAESGKRIVIMIDDIDRLDDGEIATVFKLVKLAADFSYTAYLLAFDQGVVAKALAKRYADSEGSGSSFIEKIVQVPIELPRVDEGVLQDITVEAIDKVLHGAAAKLSGDDANRFALVFQRYLAPHIGTPRMVKRIANAIEFVVPLLVGEVNIIDLLLVQTMSVLFPSVYRQMPAAKEALLGELFDYPVTNVEDVARQQLAPLFEALGDDTGDVTGALRQLFPRIERLYSNYHYGQESIPGWRAAQRICTPDYFDRFFAYGTPAGDLRDADVRAFRHHLSNQSNELTAQELSALYDKATVKRVIEKLRAVEATFDSPTALAVSSAISDTSNRLPDPRGPGPNVDSPFVQAAMHIANTLTRIDAQEREPLLRRIMSTSAVLPFASEVLQWSRVISGDQVAPQARPLTAEQITTLKGVLASRIAELSDEAPLFISMPQYAPSLYYEWRTAAGAAVVAQHMRKTCSGNVENCIALIRAFMPTAWDLLTRLRIGSEVGRNTYDSISGLVPADIILDTFAAAFPSTAAAELPADTADLNDDEQIAVRFVRIHRAVQNQKVKAVSPDQEQAPASEAPAPGSSQP
jgi:hypothetical protein